MFRKNDPYSCSRSSILVQGSDTEIGNLFTEYRVSSYDDVQVSGEASIKKAKSRKFLLHCTQRISFYNSNGTILQVDENDKTNAYENYPALFQAFFSIDAPGGIDAQVVEYSPKTVNTQIQSSGTNTTSAGETSGSSQNSTVGSSTSETNSYSASISAGFTEMNDSASINREHSSSFSSEKSQTVGSEASRSKSNDISDSASMSIKDWGAYAYVDPHANSPKWIFGQEYPWDAIVCNKTDGTHNDKNPNQLRILLPYSMASRLYDSHSLYPPSQLSLFGSDFVMKAVWLISIDDGTSEEITIDNTIFYYTASHALADNAVAVYRDQFPVQLKVKGSDSSKTTIHLSILALDPIGMENKLAVIGFIPKNFVILPQQSDGNNPPIAFKTISQTNTLLIQDTTQYPEKCDIGAGFCAAETVLSANLTKVCQSLAMTLYFKVVDTSNDYALLIKHWKKPGTGVRLTIVVNEDTANSIVKYVDSEEAEGGENNVLRIDLRYQNFSSIDYSDFLQLGLNAIHITIEAIESDFSICCYEIRALSIEKV
ncbi:hypothetical protein [Sediminispirochaeta bajacaliforniensis]|uniref:hypothetical protein n=1 Tax=Sediminispirochaeta bajacaliforniensis TaxID=148 RepID=UPI000362077F|nr:hypothetical protein [Sediminispirochaeta bajacaliforniensis]